MARGTCRFLRTLNSISSVEGRETKTFVLATPFAAQDLQNEDLPSNGAVQITDFLPGISGLGLRDQSCLGPTWTPG